MVGAGRPTAGRRTEGAEEEILRVRGHARGFLAEARSLRAAPRDDDVLWRREGVFRGHGACSLASRVSNLGMVVEKRLSGDPGLGQGGFSPWLGGCITLLHNLKSQNKGGSDCLIG